MTTRYRVEYALKTHRRDQLIEWIKGLLAVPFVLHSQPTAFFEPQRFSTDDMASHAQRRYLEIMRDVEEIINDHIAHQRAGTHDRSKLKLLVPSVGVFFTPLPIAEAFMYQDQLRSIAWRRFVAPSFNDIRLILNTAQVLGLAKSGSIDLMTFDGDVTLYDDGMSLDRTNPVIPRLMRLLEKGTQIGIVTAAGYTDARRYYERLYGLLNAIHESENAALRRQGNLIVVGGESSYLFKYNDDAPDLLEMVPREQWMLDEMKLWSEADVQALLDAGELALKECVKNLRLDAQLIRKDRAVGIVPKNGGKFPREALEETVLVTQKILELSAPGQLVPFCAFNGGNDVFVDIGDKSWGVRACQHFFQRADGTDIEASKTLHVGDQFLSAGANDFKARLACTTAWIANPAETVALLDEVAEHERQVERKMR